LRRDDHFRFSSPAVFVSEPAIQVSQFALRMMEDIYNKVSEAHRFIVEQSRHFVPEVAMILGTGLGDMAARIDPVCVIPYQDIPHFCISTVEGHKGSLILGGFGGKQVAVMQGRLHFYEGYSLEQVTFPVRVLRSLGSEFLTVNSAAGGLDSGFKPGDVMLVTDHINLIGSSPLRGGADPRLGARFPDMSRVYDRQIAALALDVAKDAGLHIKSGVYVAVHGPNLETPAETKMLRLLGADAVGMSSVPEIITAVQAGFRILFLVAITNVNNPENMSPLSITDVISHARLAEPTLTYILENTLSRMTGAWVESA
jgi:purine-nucleoside phosphorylase